jgi:spermidine synthase
MQVGPAEALFKPEFFLSMKQALAPGGIVATQVRTHLKLL